LTASERLASPPFRDAEHGASGETHPVQERTPPRRPPRTPLRVRIVEDSEKDVMLLLGELGRAGYEPLREWVRTPEKVEEALGRGHGMCSSPVSICLSSARRRRWRS
jgi:hypothetical protein